MTGRVARWYATDGTRDFLWEAYVHEGLHRARLTVLGSYPGDSATGTGRNDNEALWSAWAAYQERAT